MTASVSAPPRPRRSALRRRRAHALLGWLYAAPTAVFVVALFVIPLVFVLVISASNWPLLGGFQGWNFPDNFVHAADQRFFWGSIGFTVEYTVFATLLLVVIGLGLALLVQESSRWRGFIRVAILIPSSLGLASASLMFYALYSPYAGPFARLMEQWHFSFLGTPGGALGSTLFLIVWRYAGFYMLLMLVGLQGIPEEVYEASRIDGAGRWQTFTRVTIPLMRPTLALCTILAVTGSLLAFEQFYILTKGQPDNSTISIVQLVYIVAFQGQNDLGTASALSVIVLIALVVINIVQLRSFRGSEADR